MVQKRLIRSLAAWETNQARGRLANGVRSALHAGGYLRTFAPTHDQLGGGRRCNGRRTLPSARRRDGDALRTIRTTCIKARGCFDTYSNSTPYKARRHRISDPLPGVLRSDRADRLHRHQAERVLHLPGVTEKEGSVLALPYDSESLPSLSCLHVVEHIGLGRYGDPIEPRGTELACAELARVLAPSGNLYVSLPVGRPRVSFNAHRVHSVAQVRAYFPDIKLLSFDAVLDDGRYIPDCDDATASAQEYACGMFASPAEAHLLEEFVESMSVGVFGDGATVSSFADSLATRLVPKQAAA